MSIYVCMRLLSIICAEGMLKFFYCELKRSSCRWHNFMDYNVSGMMKIQEHIKPIAREYLPALGGAAAMFLFFLWGLVNNLSMSYMGNTSQAVVDFIFRNFLGFIIGFIGKIFFIYVIIGILLGLFIFSAVRAARGLFHGKLHLTRDFFTVITATIFIVLLVFFRDIILYPQVYINNFYVKSAFIAKIFDVLTHNISPTFFSIALSGIVLIIFFMTFAEALIRRRWIFIIFYTGFIFSVVVCMYCYSTMPSLSSRNAAATHPDVLILGSDALRPDHFSGYGYHRDTTPAIDTLIREGVSFSRTYIEVPRTFPSWVSILTGQFSATHGIRHMFPTSRDLNRDFQSIVKIFRQKGYYTSVVGDYAADIFSRIDLGFERVDAPYFNFNTVIEQAILENHTFLLPFLTAKWGLALFPSLRDSAYFCPPYIVRDKVLSEIDRAGTRPFFVTAFFSSTHFPYAPPHPYYLQYADRKYAGQYRYFKQRTISLEGDSGYEKVRPTDVEQIRALYDGGLRAFDDAVGEILAQLKAVGRLDSTIIIILSDHGENLYEGNLGMGHGEHFRGHYSTRIPFIIRYPKTFLPGSEYTGIARSVDIAPTVLELTGEKRPEYMEGISLVDAVLTKKDMKIVAYGETGIWFDNSLRDDLFFQKLRILYPDITGISEIDFHFDNQVILNDNYRHLVNFAKHCYVFDGRYKLIYMPLADRVAYELYDSMKDSDDLHDIAKSEKAQLARMKKLLFEWISRKGDVIQKNDYFFPLVRD